MARYAPAELASADPVVVCSDCGVMVADTAAHDKFHGLLRQLAPARALKGETRGQK
jgi:hypothetical protein